MPATFAPPVQLLSPHLGVSSDGFLALNAGVGADLIEALDAAVASLFLHVLLPLQVFTAVVAVKAVQHGAHGVTARPCKREEGEGAALSPWQLLQLLGAVQIGRVRTMAQH